MTLLKHTNKLVFLINRNIHLSTRTCLSLFFVRKGISYTINTLFYLKVFLKNEILNPLLLFESEKLLNLHI